MGGRRRRAVTLLLPCVLTAGAVAGDATAPPPVTVSTTAIATALDAYLAAADLVWTDPDAALRRLGRPTDAVATNADVADAMAASGAPVLAAASVVRKLRPLRQDGATVTVRASISTAFRYAPGPVDPSTDSAWTDEHELLVDASGAVPVVVADRVLAPPWAGGGGAPAGDLPVRSSDRRD